MPSKNPIKEIRMNIKNLIKEAASLRRQLREFRLQKPDNTPITPSDLYMAVNELSSGYGGDVGSYLTQAARILYKAHEAYEASQRQSTNKFVPSKPPSQS